MEKKMIAHSESTGLPVEGEKERKYISRMHFHRCMKKERGIQDENV